MLYKTTNKLFRSTYQYKIVLVCAGAAMFRSGDMVVTLEKLAKVDINQNLRNPRYGKIIDIRELPDLQYAIALAKKLKKMTGIEVRVEAPLLTIYASTKQQVESLAKLDKSRVKYICVPPENTVLKPNTIVMKNSEFDYKITIGRTRQSHGAFIEWSDANSAKVKMTKSCRYQLGLEKSWGGSYFYLAGEKALLMVQMLLGQSIAKIERITQPG